MREYRDGEMPLGFNVVKQLCKRDKVVMVNVPPEKNSSFIHKEVTFYNIIVSEQHSKFLITSIFYNDQTNEHCHTAQI